MGNVRLFKADYQSPKFRQAQPVRDLTLEHPSFGVTSATLSGNDKHKAGIAHGRGPQKTQKCRVCFALRQPVQIETTVDCLFATSDPHAHASPEWSNGWR
jgi:hypothetical protein